MKHLHSEEDEDKNQAGRRGGLGSVLSTDNIQGGGHELGNLQCYGQSTL